MLIPRYQTEAVRHYAIGPHGAIHCEIVGDMSHVTYCNIKSASRRNGHATQAYRELGAKLAGEGIRLSSSARLSPAALRIWARLADEGLAVKMGERDGAIVQLDSNPKRGQLPVYQWVMP